MRGGGIINALKKKLNANTDREVAAKLGVTSQAIRNWKNRATVTERQLAGLISSAKKASEITSQENTICLFISEKQDCRIYGKK